MPTKLSVNVNKIATLRNTRPNLNLPDLGGLSRMALEAGAHGLTIHPRPDERHIRSSDVDPIAELARAYAAEFAIEGNPFHGDFMEHCRRTRPTQCLLVPDDETQATSDHGWDVPRAAELLRPIVAELKGLGCRVSLFIDPDPVAAAASASVGADRVELYTEPYAAAFAKGDPGAAGPYTVAARAATAAGIGVNAGHDLNLRNLRPFLEKVPNVLEVSIGHALMADALVFGLQETVRRYLVQCS